MRNILRSLFIVLSCFVATIVSAQTTVTWIPKQADVTALTNTSIHYVDVGTGTKSFKVYSIRPFLNNNTVKLVWDASKNAIKMDDNGMEKAGLAIYVPTTSDNISKIVVYMHTDGTRKTYYTSGNPCPTSNPNTYTSSPIATTSTGYEFWTGTLSKDMFYAFGGRKDGSGDSYYDKIEVTFAGPAPKSTDATLSDLQVDGVTIAGFDPNTLTYNYTVPASATTAPILSATKNDAKASDPVITQPTMPTVGNPTTGTVLVTAEDETITKTYTVIFSRAEVSHDATLSDIQVDGQSIGNFNPATLSYTVNIPYSQTTIPVVTVTTTNAAAIANVTPAVSVTGTATILVTAEDGTTTQTYTVTFQKVTASTDATLKSLSYNNTPVSGFSPTTTSYSVTLPAGSYPPNVTAVANHPYATVDVQQIASTSGTVTVTVTAEDRQTTKTYTIVFSETACPTVPQTSLSIHMPKVYEKKIADGGYGGQLSVFDRCEYEVYYATYDANSNLSVSVTPIRKTDGITTSINKHACKASDGWFEMSTSEDKSDFTMPNTDEFQSGSSAVHKLKNNSKYTIHIQGYDQFSFYGKDNSGNGKYFEIHIDGVKQTMAKSTSATIRRFNISTCEHVIEVIGIGDSNEEFYGFSLRLPQVPKIERLKGNDSTQVVLQTTSISSVVYTCKYMYVEGAATRLEWDGPAANGITLNAISGSLVDTLTLSGTADCPVGT